MVVDATRPTWVWVISPKNRDNDDTCPRHMLWAWHEAMQVKLVVQSLVQICHIWFPGDMEITCGYVLSLLWCYTVPESSLSIWFPLEHSDRPQSPAVYRVAASLRFEKWVNQLSILIKEDVSMGSQRVRHKWATELYWTVSCCTVNWFW